MTKKSDAPAIRFKGFSDAWEQRKLGEMGQTYTGLSGKTKDDFGHGQARFVTYMNVFSNPISNPEMTEPIEIDPKQNEVEVGDVFFTTSSETPEEVGMSSILLEKRGKTYLNSFCFGFRPSEKIDSYYLAYMLRSESTRAKIILLAQGISRYNISKNKVMEIAVSLPSLDEQKMIGQYFSQLDNLITLHQRKFEKLTNVKKSMLEKMFPQNGSSYPEIRFKGFTDPWEQRKAKEICSIGTGKSNTQDQVDDGKYPFYIRSDVPVRSNKYLYDCEAVITIGDGNIGKVFHYVNGKFDLHQRCYKMTDFKDIWGKYFFYYFSTKFYDRAMKMTAKATVDSVRLEMISEMDIKKPPQISEQKQIAEFFANLDNLITLHQRQHFLHSTPDISLSVRLIHPFYTSSWEQRKVGDLLIERNQQAPMSDEYPLMAFIANEGVAPKGERYDRSALVTDTVNKLYKKTEKGDFIYSSNNLETGSIGLNKYGKACISPVYSIFEPTGIADSDFLGRRLVRKDFINAMVKWRQGVIYGQWRIHESDFLKIEIPVPSVEEQRKIGAYLDQLDNLITLHQRELEKLQNIKKSMLEKMFV